MRAQIGIIQFPGTNCERESAEAVYRCGMEPVMFRWKDDRSILAKCDGYLIAGGFSYEDRGRSGIIAALDPLIEVLKRETETGKPLIGICNGAQILVESGMVPGFEGYRIGAALAENRRILPGGQTSTGFFNTWVDIYCTGTARLEEGAFTNSVEVGENLHIPVAHAEGRFVIPFQVMSLLEQRGNGIFKYRKNPNGSVSDIAGLSNAHGNILALMPHPERTPDGDPIFESMRCHIERREASCGTRHCIPDLVLPRHIGLDSIDGLPAVPKSTGSGLSTEMVIGTIITDNSAVSIEQSLRRMGIPVSVQRAVHWEISACPHVLESEFLQAVDMAEDCGELYNPNKEFKTRLEATSYTATLLVRPLEGEDTRGEHALHALGTWFGIKAIHTVKHGILWTVTADSCDCTEAQHQISQAWSTGIFANPFSQRSYRYA